MFLQHKIIRFCQKAILADPFWYFILSIGKSMWLFNWGRINVASFSNDALYVFIHFITIIFKCSACKFVTIWKEICYPFYLHNYWRTKNREYPIFSYEYYLFPIMNDKLSFLNKHCVNNQIMLIFVTQCRCVCFYYLFIHSLLILCCCCKCTLFSTWVSTLLKDKLCVYVSNDSELIWFLLEPNCQLLCINVTFDWTLEKNLLCCEKSIL